MYTFPIINHLDDVKEAIEGRDEFIIAEREFGYVVNYLVSLEDTFPDVNSVNGSFVSDADYLAAVRRECRGLIFNRHGEVIARRLHKFFNVNEKPETHQDNVSLAHPHIILEKLDGSMVTPIPMPNGDIRWGTKMGITDVSMEAETFIATHMYYEELARDCLACRTTPIFEWCSRKNRIVIDYPEDRLVLIAIRDNVTGEYISYHDIMMHQMYGVEVVDHYGLGNNLTSIIEHTRALEGQEGFVIRFDNGHMFKLKGDWYCQIHRCKESLAHEKNLIDLIVNEKLDDLKPHLLPEDLKRVNTFEKDFWTGFNQKLNKVDKLHTWLREHNVDRKTFALGDVAEPWMRGVVFACWDGKNARDVMLDRIKKSLGSQSKVDAVRSLWGGLKWTEREYE